MRVHITKLADSASCSTQSRIKQYSFSQLSVDLMDSLCGKLSKKIAAAAVNVRWIIRCTVNLASISSGWLQAREQQSNIHQLKHQKVIQVVCKVCQDIQDEAKLTTSALWVQT